MARTDLETLVVRLEAQMRAYEKEWARIRGVTDRQSKAIETRAAAAAASVSKSLSGIASAGAGAIAGGVGGVLGIAGGLGAILTGGRFVTASAEAEQVVAQLEAVIRSTGGAAGYTAAELTAMAGDLQKVTTYSDEAIVSAEALLLTFTSVGREVFPQALQAILDVSTAMGQDLKSSTVQIGKALNEPITGLAALNRVGIQFSQSQKDQIKTMVQAGRTADAQRVILKELEVQFGGSARAARDTLGGALTSLNNAFGDLFEVPTENTEAFRQELEKLIAIIQDPGFAAGFQAVGAAVFSELSSLVQELRDTYYDLKFIYEQVKAGNYGEALKNIPQWDGRRNTFKDRWDALGAEAERPKTRLTVSGGGKRGAPEREEEADKNEFDKASDRLKKRIALQTVEIETMGRATAEREKARAAAELWAAAEAAGLPVTDQLRGKIDELATKWGELAGQAEEARERIQRINEISGEIGGALASGFKDAVLEGEKFDQVLANIANRLASFAIDDAFAAIFRPQTSGGTSMAGTILASLFGGGRASGGSVDAGRVYQVGERGRELFVPPVNGTIVPNFQVGSVISPNVNLSNQIIVEDRVGARVSTTEESDGRGGRRTRLVLDDMVAGAVGRPGSAANQSVFGALGARQRPRRMGA